MTRDRSAILAILQPHEQISKPKEKDEHGSGTGGAVIARRHAFG